VNIFCEQLLLSGHTRCHKVKLYDALHGVLLVYGAPTLDMQKFKIYSPRIIERAR
jgi:hypothetical protein